jgi:hypothetical protein
MGTEWRVIIEHLPIGWEPEAAQQTWFCVVNASGIVDRHEAILRRLIGGTAEPIDSGGVLVKQAVALHRGLPAFASEETRREIGSAGTIAWATPAQVDRLFKPLHLTENHWGWRFVRDSVRLLASHYGEERVRLVIGLPMADIESTVV